MSETWECLQMAADPAAPSLLNQTCFWVELHKAELKDVRMLDATDTHTHTPLILTIQRCDCGLPLSASCSLTSNNCFLALLTNVYLVKGCTFKCETHTPADVPTRQHTHTRMHGEYNCTPTRLTRRIRAGNCARRHTGHFWYFLDC